MSSPTPGSDPNQPRGNPPQGQPGWGTPQGPPQGYGSGQGQGGEGYASGQGYGSGSGQGYGDPAQGYGDPAQGYGGQGYGGPAPSYSGTPAGTGGGRPSQVTAAAIIGIVIGGLGSLFGLLGLLFIGTIFDASAVLGILYLLSLAAAVVVLVGGIQTLQGKSPRLLLLGSYAQIAIQVLSLIVSMTVGEGFSYWSLLGFVLPALIVFLLMQPQSKQYFASRGLSH